MESTSTLIVLKELAGHAQPELDALQTFIMSHIVPITNAWIAVWWMTAAVLVLKLWHEYKQQRHTKDR
jgi:hypothetical protein